MNIIGEYSSEFSYRNYLQKKSAQNNNNETDNREIDSKAKNSQEQSIREQKVHFTEERKTKEETNSNQLNKNEKKAVKELEKADRKVRQHEMAHLSAAGGIAVSGAGFEYKRGPDGRMYAVGGEVKISVSAVKDDPDATIRKAEQIKNAALAPSDPSSQDRSVAAKASQMASRARIELIKQMEKSPDENENESSLSNEKQKGIKEYSRSQNEQEDSPELTKHIDINV